MTFDYGLNAEEFFTPERKDGTARGYYRHRQMTDLLARAGQQDITAQVNFTALQTAGEAAGLRTETLTSQEQFLTRVAGQALADEPAFGEWTAERKRQFQTLVHPEFFGRAFRVLVQTRAGVCNS